MTKNTNNTDYKLDHLISIMERIALPIPPIPAIPSIPAIPAIVPNGDHDLLTKLDTKVDQIQVDVNALKNQGNQYITLQQHSELCTMTADHETRIRFLETKTTQVMTWGSVVAFIWGALILLVGYWLKN